MPGVDIIADLSDAGDVRRLSALGPKSLLCCNLLEHVLEPGRLARHCLDLLPEGGLLFVTVPFSYPYHRDPIDTMYRPSPAELEELFAGASMLNGAIVVYGRIQPIIATLATGAIYIGIALFLRPQPGGKIDDDLNWAMTNALGDFASTVHVFDDGAAPWFVPFAWIPTPFVLLLLIALLVWVPFRRSITGRTIYAIGSAEGAAYMSGLNINRAKIAAFTLGGFFAACGGLFLAIQTSSGNADLPQAGAYTLNSIASVVIGGTSLLGGTGGAIGSIFGALILRVISFFFRIFDIAPLLQPLFEGIILLAAVSIGALRVLRVKNTLELFR